MSRLCWLVILVFSAQLVWAEDDTSLVVKAGETATLPEGSTTLNSVQVGALDEESQDGAKLVIPETSNLIASQLLVGVADGVLGEVVQQGNVGITGKDFADSQITFNVGYVASTSAITNRYTIESGLLAITNQSLIVGKSGNGILEVKGGNVWCNSYFILARNENSYGELLLQGGKITIDGDLGVLTADNVNNTYSKFVIENDGVFQTYSTFRLGTGELIVRNGGRLRAPVIAQREVNANAGKTAKVLLDGGVLEAYGKNYASFIGGVQSGYYKNFTEVALGENGVTIEVPSGRTAVIAQTIIGTSDKTTCGITKTGAGLLKVDAACTYSGLTVVTEGTLILDTPNVLDWQNKLQVSAGATVAVNLKNWNTEQIDNLASKLSNGVNLGIWLGTSESQTLGDVITLPEGVGLVKVGAGLLKLTGQNDWNGPTEIREGTLQAQIGMGIPSTSNLKVAGGYWAPVENLANEIGSSAGLWQGEESRTIGLAAVDSPLCVNVGGDKRTLTAFDYGFGYLRFNDFGVDLPITVENGLSIAGNNFDVETLQTENPVVWKGGVTISSDGSLRKSGVGTLVVEGGISGGTLKVKNGELVVTNQSVNVATAIVYDDGDNNKGILTITPETEVNVNGSLSLSSATGENSCLLIEGGKLNTKTFVCAGSGTAEVQQSGGDFTVSSAEVLLAGWYNAQYYPRSSATYNLYDGSLVVNANFQVGACGYGKYNQYGGSFKFNSGWVCVGRYSGSEGFYNITGGSSTCSGNGLGMIIGEDGTGTVVVAGNGHLNLGDKRLRFGVGGSKAKASLSLSENGRITCGFIQRQNPNEKMSLEIDGGTLVAGKSSDSTDATETSTSFFQKPYANAAGGIEAVKLGPNGLTFDTNGKNVNLNDSIFKRVESGALVKEGEGVLTIDNANNFGSLVVNGGTLKFAKAPSDPTCAISDNVTVKHIIHRWSFNGNLEDSIGGQTAQAIGNVTTDGKSYKLPGGNNGTAYINLGSGAFPTDGSAVTVEIWTTENKVVSWERIFNFGLNDSQRIFFTYTRNGGTGGMSLGTINNISGGTSYSQTGGDFAFDVGTEYYVAIVFNPPTTTEECWQYTIRQYEATTGTLIRSFTGKAAKGWDIAKMSAPNCWLGRSASAGDGDAVASFNEVRIWKTALSNSWLDNQAQQGPDFLPFLPGADARPQTIELATNAVLDLGGTEFTQSVIKGGGTVKNGTLNITDGINPNGILTFDCDTVITGTIALPLNSCIESTHLIDVTQAALVVTNLQDIATSSIYPVIKTTGELKGNLSDNNLAGTGYVVCKEGNQLVIRKLGFYIMVR